MGLTKKIMMSSAIALAATLATSGLAMAEESHANKTVEQTKEAGRDLKKNAKKASRKVKDETCELVNGKMECAVKKSEHKLQNLGDEVKDATNADQD